MGLAIGGDQWEGMLMGRIRKKATEGGGGLGRGTGTNGVEDGDECDSYRPVDQWGGNAAGEGDGAGAGREAGEVDGARREAGELDGVGREAGEGNGHEWG